MQPEPLTHDDVIRVLGDADETTIAEVISTHATPSQLLAAVERLRNDAARASPPPTGRPGRRAVRGTRALVADGPGARVPGDRLAAQPPAGLRARRSAAASRAHRDVTS